MKDGEDEEEVDVEVEVEVVVAGETAEFWGEGLDWEAGGGHGVSGRWIKTRRRRITAEGGTYRDVSWRRRVADSRELESVRRGESPPKVCRGP